MLRSVVTAYLALFTLAGPCACCWAVSLRLAGRPTARTPPAADCCAPSGKSCHTCGSRCSGDHPPAPRPTEPPCPACPCGDPSLFWGAPVGKLDESFGAPWLRWLLDAAPGLFGSAGTESLTLVADPADGLVPTALPFLSAADLLHVHHRLRC
jgi:hypothetical protein